MLSICWYLHVHQPLRVKRYRVFDIGQDGEYFNGSGENDLNNARIIRKVAEKSYLPMTRVLMELLSRHPEFRFALSFSGVVLDQFEAYAPDVLAAFQALVKTGRVEILADTYHHSLAFFHSKKEFERQVSLHERRVRELFGQKPRVFRHTELAYSNDLARWAERRGYLGIMAEGWDTVLGWRSPNFLYRPPQARRIKVLLKNYRLSDDVAFRFSERSWKGWPLSAETYASWLLAHHGNGNTINLFMDFETFGEHQWADTGIFDFVRALPAELLKRPDTTFKTPTETVHAYKAVGEIDVPHVLTWADTERDLSAWMGNDIQRSALEAVYGMERGIIQSGDRKLTETWRRLQTSDHFYYMCTKWFADGDVHKYFNPYETPYDAYISYMNALSDLKERLRRLREGQPILTRFVRMLVDRIAPSFITHHQTYATN